MSLMYVISLILYAYEPFEKKIHGFILLELSLNSYKDIKKQHVCVIALTNTLHCSLASSKKDVLNVCMFICALSSVW